MNVCAGQGAIFQNAVLTSTSFTGANVEDADFTEVKPTFPLVKFYGILYRRFASNALVSVDFWHELGEQWEEGVVGLVPPSDMFFVKKVSILLWGSSLCCVVVPPLKTFPLMNIFVLWLITQQLTATPPHETSLPRFGIFHPGFGFPLYLCIKNENEVPKVLNVVRRSQADVVMIGFHFTRPPPFVWKPCYDVRGNPDRRTWASSINEICARILPSRAPIQLQRWTRARAWAALKGCGVGLGVVHPSLVMLFGDAMEFFLGTRVGSFRGDVTSTALLRT